MYCTEFVSRYQFLGWMSQSASRAEELATSSATIRGSGKIHFQSSGIPFASDLVGEFMSPVCHDS